MVQKNTRSLTNDDRIQELIHEDSEFKNERWDFVTINETWEKAKRSTMDDETRTHFRSNREKQSMPRNSNTIQLRLPPWLFSLSIVVSLFFIFPFLVVADSFFCMCVQFLHVSCVTSLIIRSTQSSPNPQEMDLAHQRGTACWTETHRSLHREEGSSDCKSPQSTSLTRDTETSTCNKCTPSSRSTLKTNTHTLELIGGNFIAQVGANGETEAIDSKYNGRHALGTKQ